MAPWPEQGNEPKAPDKSCPKGVESNPSDSSKVDSGTQEDTEAKAALGKTDDKQDDKNSGVSELDDGQLRALLDEAITYKCPKDREGKSNLFRELLEEVEAESDGGEESNPPPFGIVDQCRGGKRRRRDAAVSERQTRGGSLQNIVQAYSDFESVYFGNRGKKSFGGGRKKGEFYHYGLGPGSSGGGACGRGVGVGGGGSSGEGSVSARQREGGSLPCNVNAGGVGGGGCGGGSLLHGPSSECPFEGVVRRRRSEQRVSWEQDNEDVMPAHMDRGGGGPVSAPPPADVVTARSEAGVDSVGEVDKGRAGPPSKEEPLDSIVVVGEGVPNGVSDGNVSRHGESEGSKTDRVVEVPTSVELRAQCCATLLSSAVDDGTGEGVELLELHVSEDRDSGFKSKGETCRRGAVEVQGFGSEPSITASVPATSSSPVTASSSASDRKVRREVMRGDSVDTVVPFSLQLDDKKPLLSSSCGSMILDLSKGLVNGMETAPLQLPSSYPSVKSLVGSSTSPISSTPDSTATLASSSSASAHVGCGDSQSAQTGVSEDRNGVGGSVKEMTMRKQQLGETQTKPVMPMQGTYSMSIPGHNLSVLAYPPNNWIASPDSVSRINFHGCKDLSDVKSKSLDENGNSVTMSQGINKEVHEKSKGKTRRPKTNNDRNVFLSQNIEGFRGDQDLDCLLKFIGTDEEKKSKNTNNGAVERVRRSNFRRESDRSSVSNDVGSGRVRAARERNGASEDKDDVSASCGSATAGGEKGSSGSKVGRAGGGSRQQQQIQRSSKMKKSNSLEEISKTKSEDLTVSGPKKEQEGSKNKYVAANSPITDNTPKQAKETVQNTFGGSYKQDLIENSDKDEVFSNCNDKLSKGDQNGNSELGNKSGVTSAAKMLLPATSFKEDFYAVTDASPQVLEETEFHVVTKKQRRKKRRAGAGDGVPMEGRSMRNSRDGYSYSVGSGGNGDRPEDFKRAGDRSDGGSHLEVEGEENVWDGGATGDGRFLGSYRRHHRRHRSQRSGDHLKSTSSVPPSEHSGESSDDSDSVHSLPVSSSVARPPVDPSSTSSGSTPQASYADIARMAFSGTMPVMIGNQGNSTPGNPVPSTYCTQKLKASPITAESPGQTNFPPVSCTNPSVNTSMPYIGSAKLNIGAPPISGSKVTSPSVLTGDVPVLSSVGSVPKSESQVSTSEDLDSTPETDTSVLSIHNSTIVSLQANNEPRKKDAMTCTALDGKTISNNYSYTVVPSPQSKVEVETSAQSLGPSTPNILEDYYPSLQESLHEKIERRNGKLSQHQTPSNKVSSVEEKRSSKSAVPSPSATTASESKVSEVETLVNTNVVPIAPSGEKTSMSSVVEKPVAVVAVKTKEPTVTATRIKGSGKKPGFRSLPPVVILDHHYRQDGGSKEGAAVGILSEVGGASTSGFNSADIGGFTFGFEVNEELLALSGGDNMTCGTPCSPEVEKKPNGSPSIGEEESEVLPAPPETSPGSQRLSSGKESMPVFRSPGELDTKRFNYEKIVSFIGLSWEDVLKEMSVPVKHTGSRVQYYGGQ